MLKKSLQNLPLNSTVMLLQRYCGTVSCPLLSNAKKHVKPTITCMKFRQGPLFPAPPLLLPSLKSRIERFQVSIILKTSSYPPTQITNFLRKKALLNYVAPENRTP